MGDIVNKITGQDEADRLAKRLANRTPTQLDAGGLRTNLVDGRITVTPSAERGELVGGIQDVLRGGARDLRGLREGADTPLSRLRQSITASNEAALERLSDAERRAVGDVSENLQRRRVLGSSFGQDALARVRSEFGRAQAEQEAQAGQRLAQTALQELDLKTNLIERETALQQQAVQTALQDLNLQAEVGSRIAAKTDSAIQENQRLRLQVAQESASGFGELIGTVGGALIGGFFGGPAGAAAGASVGGQAGGAL